MARPKSEIENITITIRCPRDLVEEYRMVAKSVGSTKSALMVKAMREFLKTDPVQKHKDALKSQLMNMISEHEDAIHNLMERIECL